MADLYRFERYALDVINKHGYDIKVTDGKVYLAEPGKAHKCPMYNKEQLDHISRQIENELRTHQKLTPEQQKLPLAAHIQQLTPNQQELLVAARIAVALPELRRNLHDDTFSAEFASSVCRISAAVPDPDAGARLLSERLSGIAKKGGASSKQHAGLQKFINRIAKKLAATGKVTHDRVWQHLVKEYPSQKDDGVETKIPDFDNVYTDGDYLCWIGSNSKDFKRSRSSLKPYVARAKKPPL